MVVDKHATSHFGFLKSTHPIDIIKWEKDEKHYLTFKLTGGVVNFRYISDKSPDYVI